MCTQPRNAGREKGVDSLTQRCNLAGLSERFRDGCEFAVRTESLIEKTRVRRFARFGWPCS